MLTLLKTLDSDWMVARQSLRQDLDTIETVLNRRWGQIFGQSNLLSATVGGTGLTSYAIGDLLYASSTTTLARLGVGTVGKILRSTGTLPTWSGFTIVNAFVQGDLVYAGAANALTALAKSVTATRYLSNTGAANAPAWAQVDLTNGVTGTLPAGNGGTGVTSLGTITKADDTNVTLTLGGTPANSTIQSVSFTLGWAGTLAAARLNANVVQAVSNDTNITGSIGVQTLTLAWAGVLSVARGGIGVGTLTSHGLLYGAGTSAITAGTALTSGKIPIATTNGVLIDGQTPLSGTKVYYVSDTSGGAVTRKLTFTDGILVSET